MVCVKRSYVERVIEEVRERRVEESKLKTTPIAFKFKIFKKSTIKHLQEVIKKFLTENPLSTTTTNRSVFFNLKSLSLIKIKFKL